MDTTNSSEKPQRRVKHGQRPTEPLADWPAEFGAAGAEQPAATSGDAPADEQWMFDLAAEYESRGAGLYGPITFTAQQLPNFVQAVIARIERAASPATASGDELLSQITDTKSARRFVRDWHLKNFPTDRTFSRYIMAEGDRTNPLAGDFAWQLAKALEAVESRAAVSAATKPTACALPPTGWVCTREPGHDGPCAAVPSEDKQSGAARNAALQEAIQAVRDQAIHIKGLPERTGEQEAYNEALEGSIAAIHSLLATKPAAAPAVPEGFVLMPKRLTAENGAKAAMIAEFYEEITVRCPDCDNCDEDQYCAGCNDEGTVQQPVQVQWDTIKQIYTRAVELLAAPPAASTIGAAQTADQVSGDNA